MRADAFGLVGKEIEGKYRVDAVVGEGGFGVVYRGYRASFEDQVAIKCLKLPAHFTHEAKELFLERFREEGKHLSRLCRAHLSVVQVYGFGVLEGVAAIPYLVLEWLEGKDLATVLAQRGRGYGEREAVSMLRQAIEAIGIAHRMRIAHLDLKPGNLYLARDGQGVRMKVLDFGIGKAMQEGETATQLSTQTQSGFRSFSPVYGAPEQFQSKKYGPTGPWTDVHALGLILVGLVTGRAVLDGEGTHELSGEGPAKGRPTPRARGADVSDGFEQVCAKALSLMPSERYPDAEALLCALEAATGGTEPRVGERAERQEKEGRLVAGQQAFAGGSREEGEEGGGARLGGLVETFVPSGAKAGTTTDRSMVEQQLKRGGMGNRRRVLVLGSVAGAVVVVVGVILWSRSEGNGQETTAGREAAAVMTEPPVRPKPGTYVRIEPGTFMMGSPTDERGRQSHETQHKVTLTHAFMMKATEVTQGEWVAVMGSNPSHFSNCGASCPVEKVSWDEAIVYANVVSQKEGLEGCYKDGDKDYDMSSAQGGRTPRWPKGLSCAGYRLPTEAEWEYAARAGTTTAYHTGAITVPAGEDPNLDKAGWYVRNSGSATHPVGEKAANAWGLHDVYGNVSEWVSDWKGENGSGDQTDPVGPRMGVERVFRGGSFRHAPWDCRSASSFSVPPGHRSYSLGFRLSRSIP